MQFHTVVITSIDYFAIFTFEGGSVYLDQISFHGHENLIEDAKINKLLGAKSSIWISLCIFGGFSTI